MNIINLYPQCTLAQLFVAALVVSTVFNTEMVSAQNITCANTQSICEERSSELRAWEQRVIEARPGVVIEVPSLSVGGSHVSSTCTLQEEQYCSEYFNDEIYDTLTPVGADANLDPPALSQDPDEVTEENTDSVVTFGSGDLQCFRSGSEPYLSSDADVLCNQVAAERGLGGCTIDQNASLPAYCLNNGISDNDFVLGTGDQCFSSLSTCERKMLSFLPDNRENTFRANNCDPNSQENCLCNPVTKMQCEWDNGVCDNRPGPNTYLNDETRYCMNNEGIAGLTPEQVAAARENQRRQTQNAAYQARIAANEARISADSQALRDSDSLVICSAWDCGWEELIDMVNRVIRFLITIAGVIVVIVMMYAGWTLVTSQGSVSKKDTAKAMLTRSIAGFVLVLTAWLIVDVIASTLLDDDLESDPIVDILGDN